MKSISTVIYFKYKNGHIPLVYLLKERKFPSLPTAFLFYIKNHKNYSFEKIKKLANSISLLYQFYEYSKDITYKESLVAEFTIHRFKGDILDWNKVSKSTANQDYLNLKEFSLWCHNNFNTLDFANEYKIKNLLKDSYIKTIKPNTILLSHLDKKESQSFFKTTTNNTPKIFPMNKIIPLINSANNPRDKIILILMAFGGKRISEISHLFITDFLPQNGEINVRIAHPQSSYYEWIDSNQLIKGTREDYLNKVFNLTPRNLLDKNSLFSGWKGMTFDDEQLKMSEIYFIADVKKILYKLHIQYMKEIRNKFNHHPYYFIKKNGEPLTIKGIRQVFYRHCNKIGLTEHNSLLGINPHGLRHFYGYYCYEILGLNLILIQRYMGHVNDLSTQIYARMSKRKITEIIKNKIKTSNMIKTGDLNV